ncbi:hypothetical protein, partial [Xanthomonas oryzae]|uniref:hypothetical protein n=1 Tax=Xanthomonas oryzae TaxID=347 RepID=UPI001ED9B2D4
MIAAMQSLDSGLATDRRIHSISPIQPGSPWSAGFGSVWLACEYLISPNPQLDFCFSPANSM